MRASDLISHLTCEECTCASLRSGPGCQAGTLLLWSAGTVQYIYLRARPDTALEERRPISERDVQLSTTDKFCRKNGKCCTIKYCISFLRILDFF